MEACKKLKEMVEEHCMIINREFVSTKNIPLPLIRPILNMSCIYDFFYKDTIDIFTDSSEFMKKSITKRLHNIPLTELHPNRSGGLPEPTGEEVPNKEEKNHPNLAFQLEENTPLRDILFSLDSELEKVYDRTLTSLRSGSRLNQIRHAISAKKLLKAWFDSGQFEVLRLN
ncbi:hypothetical protein IEQ34_012884 [Dendrobium chrysotoxum]|uniref:Uncharacterized protein n=1 Tax=Dendrobium chrysotoxum TaxID=161865 RepID=A0AAV7GPG2_DENCH|nr:hypothetical protein IEQ34_012884 [Dendrobium chrysotoxum]